MGDEARLDDRLRRRLPRIIGAAMIMGGALFLGELALGPALSAQYWRFAALAALIGIGIVSYFVAGTLLGAFSLSDFRRLRRKS